MKRGDFFKALAVITIMPKDILLKDKQKPIKRTLHRKQDAYSGINVYSYYNGKESIEISKATYEATLKKWGKSTT